MIGLTDTIALRVPHTIKEQIEKLAQVTKRKKSDILLGWISEKLALEEWQIAETKIAIDEADAGMFASEAEVAKVKAKWRII